MKAKKPLHKSWLARWRVTKVDNMLIVFTRNSAQSEIILSDLLHAQVVTVVKTRLLFESHLRGTQIDVQANKGVVILSAKVQDPTEKRLAMTITKNTKDVKSVIDQLNIGE
ncbi:MAG: hyperosmotically inducible protein [Paraglaciecola sp.]|jgi:hyperosmotically inducible protein